MCILKMGDYKTPVQFLYCGWFHPVIVDNTPTTSDNFTLLCYQGLVLLTTPPPQVRTLPSTVTKCGMVNNTLTTRKNFTLIYYPRWYC